VVSARDPIGRILSSPSSRRWPTSSRPGHCCTDPGPSSDSSFVVRSSPLRSTTPCWLGLLLAGGLKFAARRLWLLGRPSRPHPGQASPTKEDDHGGSSEDDLPDAAARALEQGQAHRSRARRKRGRCYGRPSSDSRIVCVPSAVQLRAACCRNTSPMSASALPFCVPVSRQAASGPERLFRAPCRLPTECRPLLGSGHWCVASSTTWRRSSGATAASVEADPAGDR
jgi:hypothetical protein